VLKVPSKVGVYVKNTLKPKRVELWMGPTGIQFAELHRCVDSTQQSVSAGQRKKFTFTITSCKEVDNRLEPRVYVADATNAYSVYAGPFECRSK